MKRATKVTGMAVSVISLTALFLSYGTQRKSYAAVLARTPIKTFTGFAYGAAGIQFSPDGKIVAAADGESVKIWETQTGKLITSLNPHKESVDTIAMTPDGKIIATAGCDTMKVAAPGEDYDEEYQCEESFIKFWDVQSGQLVRTLPGHHGFWRNRGERWDDALNRAVMERMYIGAGIRGLEFSKDGEVLVSSGFGDDTLKIWDVDSGRELRVYIDQHFTDFSFSPDGKTLALQNQQGILLMDYRTGENKIQLKDGEAPVFSRDGRMIASACGDETIKLWDITREAPIRIFFGHSDDPFAVAFSADGKVLASGGYDKNIILWDVENGGEIARLSGHRGAVFDLKLSPDGKILASAGAERYSGGEYLQGSIKFWDATSFSGQAPVKAPTGIQFKELVGHEGQIQAIAFNPQGDRLASVSLDAYLKVWDISSGKELYTARGDRMGGSFESVAFSSNGKIIATGAGAVIQLIDANSGQILNVINKGIQTDVDGIAFSPRGRIFSIASGLFKIPIYDIESGLKLAELDEGLKDGFSAKAVAFSPDGSMLATASAVAIKIWDLETEKVILKWTAHPPSIESIAFSPDGKLLASAGWDKVVKLWDVQTGKLVRSMSGHRGYIVSLAFSPDGKTLATGSNDFTIRFWDVATGKMVRTITEKYFVEDVAFSPDGLTLAAAIYKSVKIWKL